LIFQLDLVTTCGYNEGMKVVGIRELKARLSEYIRRIREGEEVLVTDRGKVVAELRPPRRLTPEPRTGLDELGRKGLADLGAPNDPEAYPELDAIVEPGEGTRLLGEERGNL
jgi:antitoxin (DNA-binding transcriptional repressor) of toxin-antitoxin stability system